MTTQTLSEEGLKQQYKKMWNEYNKLNRELFRVKFWRVVLILNAAANLTAVNILLSHSMDQDKTPEWKLVLLYGTFFILSVLLTLAASADIHKRWHEAQEQYQKIEHHPCWPF